MPVVFEDSGCIIPRNQLLAASISRQQTQRKLTGLKLSRDREITFNKNSKHLDAVQHCARKTDVRKIPANC